MTRPPLVSVCIANFNGIDIIDDCIRSVLAQEGDLAVEILVHDDASTDGSAEYIRSHYPDVILIESRENVGYCVSNNRMVDRAVGEYVLLLNNDAALYTDALSTLYARAKALGRPAILGLPQYEWEHDQLYDMGCLLDPFLNAVPNRDPDRRDVAMVAGACLWIPRHLWIELGGFPDWFGSIAEDLYLCCRARLAGYPVCISSKSGFRHRVGQSFGGGKVASDNHLVTTRRRRALSERNKSFVLALTYPPPMFYLLLPVHLGVLMLEGIALSLVKLDWRLFRDIYLNCPLALWRERRRLWQLRRVIQAGRRIGPRDYAAVFVAMPYKLRMLIRHGLPRVV